MAFDLNAVAGRVNGFQRALGVEFDFHADVLDGCGGKLFSVERIQVAHEAVVGLEHLRVGERDPFVAARFDGEDADLEHVPPCVLQQGWVAHFADDILINTAGLVGQQKLGLDRLAVDLHRELVDLRAGWHREQIRTLKALIVGVVKLLIDCGRRNLAGNLDVDMMVHDLQRRELVVGGRAGAVGRIVNNDESIGQNVAGNCQQSNQEKNTFFHDNQSDTTAAMLFRKRTVKLTPGSRARGARCRETQKSDWASRGLLPGISRAGPGACWPLPS